MTKWIVELEDLISSEVVGEALQFAGYSLSKEGYWLLSHPKYFDYTDVSQVYEDAKYLNSQLRSIAKLEGQNFGFSVVGVQQSKADGTIQSYVFATAK